MPEDSAVGNVMLETRKVLDVEFNQDGSCFTVCYPDGFQVFNADPMTSLKRIVYEDGGLARAAMLYQSNRMVLVGGGPLPKYPINQVALWDDKAQALTATVEFRSAVTATRLEQSILAVGLKNRIFLYRTDQGAAPVKLDSWDASNCCQGTSMDPAGWEWLMQ